MVFNIFTKEVKKPQNSDKVNGVYSALVNGLNEMSKRGANRVILTIYESEPDKNATGRWIDIGKETNYYPFEMLDEQEQEMILGGKHYTVVSLVLDNIDEVIKYPNNDVEQYDRTHIVPFLPVIKEESNLNYVTKGGVYTGENLRQFAEDFEKSGWTEDLVKKRIEAGIQKYNSITKRLIKNSGVYEALERMEERQVSQLEEMLAEIRENIKLSERNN